MSDLASKVLDAARARGLQLATAESCTGGMIAAALTEVAGSSDVFDRGFVTYSNEAKADMLGVPMPEIETHGAVSEPVAWAMAAGALNASRADIAISVTGIAGPGGGSVEKPVGLVFMGLATKTGTDVRKHIFEAEGDARASVRAQTVEAALNWIYEVISARP